ncbi:MAG: toll/interleukin-1 receptor domain-containing protein [Hydrogenophilaceae bacterium]
MEARQEVAKALERLAAALGWLGQGMPGVECTDLMAMLRELVEQLATRTDEIPAELLERIEVALQRDGLDGPNPEWCAAAMASLRQVRAALAAPEEGLRGDDDAFAGYCNTLSMDGEVQYADTFELPECADAGAAISLEDLEAAGLASEPSHHHAKPLSERAGRVAGVPPEKPAWVEPPDRHVKHAKPAEREVPRMVGAIPEQASPVRLGAAAPAACRPGGEFTARFVAYPPDDEVEVAELLHKLSPRSTSHLGLGQYVWKNGTRVQVSLSAKGLTVDPPVQDMVWQGERVVLNFDVAVPDDAGADTVVLKFDVVIDGFTVARLRLDLEIAAGAGSAATRVAQAEAARTAFASYSSQDRQRVLDRVAALQIDTGMDIFLDCLSLHPGQHWESRLAEEIHRRDLFMLFWSTPAAQSQWVEWEWRRALAEGKKDTMEIHPLENGVMPPPELGDLHFADPAMAVRAASAPPP